MNQSGHSSRRIGWLFVSFSRGLAFFMALYSLLSLAAAIFGDAYNQNAWWIDFSFLINEISLLEQLALTVALGFFALHVPRSLVARVLTTVPVFVGLFTAVSNTLVVYAAAADGTIILGFPLPFSFFVACGLLCICISILFGHTYLLPSRTPGKLSTVAAMGASCVLTILLFPLGQMHCFGTTDYRVSVDAAVVLGARVYSDGTPSPVLQDRLDTAIAFYEEGYTSTLVMSGGIDGDGTSEALAMRDYAVELGVPSQDIIVDEQGSNTKQTARNTVEMLQAAGLTNIAAVSNFYHLPRVKMLYLDEGINVVTVPSVPNKDPGYPMLNVVREIPGWWYYWALNLVE